MWLVDPCVHVIGNGFFNLDTVVRMIYGYKFITGNICDSCNNMSVPHGFAHTMHNTYNGGALANTVDNTNATTAVGVSGGVSNMVLALSGVASSSALASSLFIDSADNKLKWKDAFNAVHILY